LVVKFEGRDHSEGLDVDGKIILKWMLEMGLEAVD
jgi:hypothetical protein